MTVLLTNGDASRPDDGAAGFVDSLAVTYTTPQGAVFALVEHFRLKAAEKRQAALSSRD